MQGYWISRPLPLDDFVRWLKKPYTPQWEGVLTSLIIHSESMPDCG
ncbi:hypothetical protein ACVXG8_22765 [Escherichia coli]